MNGARFSTCTGQLYHNPDGKPSGTWIGLGRSDGTDPFTWIPSGTSHNHPVKLADNQANLCGFYHFYNTNGATAVDCTIKKRNILCESRVL